MANATSLLVNRTLGAASELVYSSPAATSTVLNYLSVCNPTSATRSVTIGIGTNAATTVWRKDLSISGSATHEWNGALPLNPTQIVAMDADEASALNVLIGGLRAT